MRRWVFLCLLLLLPLQTLWSAVAAMPQAPCMAMQSPSAHAGGEAPCPEDLGTTETAAAPCCEGGCGSHCVLCDELGVVGLISVPVLLGASPGMPQASRLRAGLPDHIPELPSRPPSHGLR